jgi:hypothetical protein
LQDLNFFRLLEAELYEEGFDCTSGALEHGATTQRISMAAQTIP